jgi:hypothetical protein
MSPQEFWLLVNKRHPPRSPGGLMSMERYLELRAELH